MKHNKQALAKSVLALLLCVAVLVGTTFAWFTDSVVSGINTIAAGNLDVELYHSNAAVTNQKVTANTQLFLDLQGNPILWEPGVVSYENLRVTNEGDLALIYQMAINTANENYILDNGAQYGLSQVLKVGVVENGITATDRDGVVASVNSWTTLANFLCDGSLLADGEKTWGVVIYWQPGDDDNNWNANNGKQLSSGTALSIDLGIKLTATQMQYENDHFGPDYDVNAGDDVFPAFQGGIASVPVTPNANGYTTEAVTISVDGITAHVPAGVKLGVGVDTLTLTIANMASSESNVVLGEDEAMRSLNVHVDGVADDNTTPITITLPEVAPKALNMGNYKVYHVESTGTNEMTLVAADADFTAHNQFKYDPATGNITLHMASFSEVALVAEFAKWEGNIDHSWYNASATQLYIANGDQLYSFGQIVGGMAEGIEQDDFAGKTVTLIANINLDDVTDENSKIFHPIGYYYNGDDSAPYSTVYSFDGTFDGNGHTIANFYQNTWEIKGDYEGTYYKDAMGLFGYVVNATIKNLTVKNFSSDGEFTPTGVIAAYACNSTFENIAIVDCNPRVYNTGNGGIVGIGGNNDDPDSYKLTFTNITVDNSNKITALWGSWDVACGGLVGMFRGAGHVYMTNCHVGAQIDVYNDVCGNYQYYWYRYAGSLIGTNKNMITDADGYTVPETSKYHATNCTVHFGDWNDYYYCELVANSLASYTHDHQMSRLTVISSLSEIKSGNTWTKTGNFLLFGANGQQKQDGEGTCYHIVKDANGNLVQHFHEDAGKETVNGAEVLKEDNQRLYLPFNQIFTGYGWGVKHIPVGEFGGVTVLDRAEASSVNKWTPAYADTLISDVTVKLSELFKLGDTSVDILNNNVVVSVTNLDDSNVTATYTRNDSNWKASTLKLSGAGRVQITIQDYYFCTPTTITVTVKEPSGVPQIPNNLIVNGNYESGNRNNWVKDDWTTSVSCTAAKTGNYGMVLTGTSAYNILAQQKNIPVEDGEKYVFTMWYKANAFGVNIIVKGEQTNHTYINKWETSTDWKKYSEIILVDGDTSLIVQFASGGEVRETHVFVDDISLVKTTPLVNGDFEDGKNGWTLNNTASVVSGDAYSGDYALKVSNPKKWNNAAIQYISVEPNTAYEITFWAKYVSGSGVVNFWPVNGSNIYGQNWMSEQSGNWVKYTIIMAPDEGVSQMGLQITAEADNTTATYLIDNVTITKTFAYNGTVRDGGFELGYPIKWTLSSGCSISTEAALSGNYGLKLKTTAGSWNSIASHGFATEIGKTYTITLYSKISSNETTGGVNFEMRNADSSKVSITHIEGQKYPNGITDKEWTKHAFSFTATSTESYFHIFCNGEWYSATVYIDDITIVGN